MLVFVVLLAVYGWAVYEFVEIEHLPHIDWGAEITIMNGLVLGFLLSLEEPFQAGGENLPLERCAATIESSAREILGAPAEARRSDEQSRLRRTPGSVPVRDTPGSPEKSDRFVTRQ